MNTRTKKPGTQNPEPDTRLFSVFHPAPRTSHPALRAILAAALLLALLPALARAEPTAGVDGVSLKMQEGRDILTLKMPFNVSPEYHRYSDPNRVVITLPGVEALPTLNSLVAGWSSTRVEKIETQTVRRGAVSAGAEAGVRYRSSAPETVITTYLKPDVDVAIVLDKEARTVTINYYRVDAALAPPAPAQLPVPQNSLRSVRFFRRENSETVELSFLHPVESSAFETGDPERLFVLLRRTNLPEPVNDEIRRVVQMPRIFKLEIFNIGSQPIPYDSMHFEREYHFVGFPSPLAVDVSYGNVTGFQQRDAVVAIRPAGALAYNVERSADGRQIFITVYASQPETSPDAECAIFYRERMPYLTTNPPFQTPYSIETESGVVLDIEEQ